MSLYTGIIDFDQLEFRNPAIGRRKLGVVEITTDTGVPTFTPASTSIYIDQNTNIAYIYYGGAWHQIV